MEITIGKHNLTLKDVYLKKGNFSQSDVHLIESLQSIILNHINTILFEEYETEMDLEKDDWIVLNKDLKPELLIDIENSFYRLIIHSMCRYYCLKSKTVEKDCIKILISVPYQYDDFEFPSVSFVEYFTQK